MSGNSKPPIPQLPPIPPQGFGPHVELDETGRIAFAPPAALDAEGNNLPRLRALLPQLIEIADELSEFLARGNQPHSALIRRLAAYRSRLTPDLAQVALARVVTEAIRFESAAAAAQSQIDANELPPHDAEAHEALTSLLRFNRMFAMATTDGPAMLADEARYKRTHEEEAAYQAGLRNFAADVLRSPDAIASDVAETLSDALAQPGDFIEAARVRRIGDSLASNIAITSVAAAIIGGIVTALATQGPLGVVTGAAAGFLGLESLKRSKPYAVTVDALRHVYDRAQDLHLLREHLAPATIFVTRAAVALRTLGHLADRFAWLPRALDELGLQQAPDLTDTTDGDALPNPLTPEPSGDPEPAEVHRSIIAGKHIPLASRQRVRELHLGLPAQHRLDYPLTKRKIAEARKIAIGKFVSSAFPLAQFPNLAWLDLWGTPVVDLSPLSDMAKLYYLELSGTCVADLAGLSRLSNLQSLYLGGTLVTDLTPLAALANLQSLDLDATQVSDLTPLAALGNLQSLDLQDTQVTDLTPLVALAKLQSLDLSSTQVVDVNPLAALANLQFLRLSDTKVTDLTPLATLPNLQSLHLHGLSPGIENTLPRRAKIRIIR